MAQLPPIPFWHTGDPQIGTGGSRTWRHFLEDAAANLKLPGGAQLPWRSSPQYSFGTRGTQRLAPGGRGLGATFWRTQLPISNSLGVPSCRGAAPPNTILAHGGPTDWRRGVEDLAPLFGGRSYQTPTPWGSPAAVAQLPPIQFWHTGDREIGAGGVWAPLLGLPRRNCPNTARHAL